MLQAKELMRQAALEDESNTATVVALTTGIERIQVTETVEQNLLRQILENQIKIEQRVQKVTEDILENQTNLKDLRETTEMILKRTTAALWRPEPTAPATTREVDEHEKFVSKYNLDEVKGAKVYHPGEVAPDRSEEVSLSGKMYFSPIKEESQEE